MYTVLVVEDNPANIAEARSYFSNQSRFSPRYAEDYAQAKIELCRGGLDALISDIFFPEEKGTGKRVEGLLLSARIIEEVLGTPHPSLHYDIFRFHTDVSSDDEAKQPLGIKIVESAAAMGLPYVLTSSLHAAHSSSATPVFLYLVKHGLVSPDGKEIIESNGYGHNADTDKSDPSQGLKYVKREDVWSKAAEALLERISRHRLTQQEPAGRP